MSAVVTQADRERAAEVYGPGFFIPLILAGKWDDTGIVQAFAAHREAHTAGLVAALCEIAGNNWRDQSRAKHVARAALSEHGK